MTATRLIAAIEARFASGAPIPAPHDVDLADALGGFLGLLRGEAFPTSLDAEIVRFEELPRLRATFTEVAAAARRALERYPAGAPTPHSHRYLTAALSVARHRDEDRGDLLPPIRVAREALATEADPARGFALAQALARALRWHAVHPKAPCEELGDELLAQASALRRLATMEHPRTAQEPALLLELVRMCQVSALVGKCQPAWSWRVGRELLRVYETSAGPTPPSAKATLSRTLTLAVRNAPSETASTLGDWEKWVVALEQALWRTQGKRGELLQAVHSLARAVGQAHGHAPEALRIPTRIDPTALGRAAPNFEALVGRTLEVQRALRAAGDLDPADRRDLVTMWGYLLRAFTTEIRGSGLESLASGVLDLPRKNLEALRTLLARHVAATEPQDPIDHELQLRLFFHHPPDDLAAVRAAFDAAAGLAPDKAQLGNWVRLGRPMAKLLSGRWLPAEVGCEEVTAWLDRRQDHVLDLGLEHPNVAARAAAQLVATHWALGREAGRCSRLASWSAARALAERVLPGMAYTPDPEDPLDWAVLTAEVRAWPEAEAATPLDVAAWNGLREVLATRVRASPTR